MKYIIAGGRNYKLVATDFDTLDQITPGITEVVSGHNPTGADRAGELWATSRGVPVKLFPANWGQYRRAAGPIRNKQMAAYADAAVLFPGDKGTASMEHEARMAGIPILKIHG